MCQNRRYRLMVKVSNDSENFRGFIKKESDSMTHILIFYPVKEKGLRFPFFFLLFIEKNKNKSSEWLGVTLERLTIRLVRYLSRTADLGIRTWSRKNVVCSIYCVTLYLWCGQNTITTATRIDQLCVNLDTTHRARQHAARHRNSSAYTMIDCES